MNFSLKPVFIGWITLLSQLPIQLFATVWCGAFFGAMFDATGIFGRDNAISFLVFGGSAFVLIPFIAYFGKKLNYGKTEYRFFDDRLEFEEGFFTINKKVIKFKDVKEVTLRKGLFQRMYGLGTIYLATLATGSSPHNNVFGAFGFGNVSASGVGIRDIEDPDQNYDKIKAQVEARNV